MPGYAQVKAMFPSMYDGTPYAWIITKDRLWEDKELCEHSVIKRNGECIGCFTSTNVGMRGPNQATDIQFALANACGRKFRMLDDDGIVYYEGYLWSAEFGSDETEFGPLEDFGMPNDGCTDIQYLISNGMWVSF